MLNTVTDFAPNGGTTRIRLLNETIPNHIGVTLDLIQAAYPNHLIASGDTVSFSWSNAWAIYRVEGWEHGALDCEFVQGGFVA